MTTTIESSNALQSLPEGARIWIYAADRTLDEAQRNRLLELLASFCADWKSHGRTVESAPAVVEGRFAVIAGVIPGGDISGCGIDASVHALQRAADELDVAWLPALTVHYRADDGSVSSVSRQEFRSLVRSGSITAETPVFDMSIETLGELRGGQFERPAKATWHGRVFGLAESAVSH